MATDLIRGHVVSILNEREMAISVGASHGVVDGMFFDVLESPRIIFDTQTNKRLGTLQRPKVRVRVNHVEQEFSVAITFQSRKVNRGGLSQVGAWASLLMPANWVQEYETLRAKDHRHGLWSSLDEKESFVKRGDPVAQVRTRPSDTEEGGNIGQAARELGDGSEGND